MVDEGNGEIDILILFKIFFVVLLQYCVLVNVFIQVDFLYVYFLFWLEDFLILLKELDKRCRVQKCSEMEIMFFKIIIGMFVYLIQFMFIKFCKIYIVCRLQCLIY